MLYTKFNIKPTVNLANKIVNSFAPFTGLSDTNIVFVNSIDDLPKIQDNFLELLNEISVIVRRDTTVQIQDKSSFIFYVRLVNHCLMCHGFQLYQKNNQHNLHTFMIEKCDKIEITTKRHIKGKKLKPKISNQPIQIIF